MALALQRLPDDLQNKIIEISTDDLEANIQYLESVIKILFKIEPDNLERMYKFNFIKSQIATREYLQNNKLDIKPLYSFISLFEYRMHYNGYINEYNKLMTKLKAYIDLLNFKKLDCLD